MITSLRLHQPQHAELHTDSMHGTGDLLLVLCDARPSTQGYVAKADLFFAGMY